MKLIKYIVFLLAIVSCKTQNEDSQNNSKKDYLSYNFIQKKIKEAESVVNQQKCDFNSIKKQVQVSREIGIASIPVIEGMVKHCIGSLSQSEKDSVYLLFIDMYYQTINPITDSLYTQYKAITEKLDKNIDDDQTKDFKKCLDACGTELLMTEGSYYLDAKFDYFYSIFKGKVSADLDDFLKIRSIELKQGYSEDAGLLISFEDLYKRVIGWEDIITKYPDFFLKDYSEYYYSDYLSTLLTGMDNTPVFDFESQKLLPEVKKLYERVITLNDSRKSSKIISNYYNLLKKTDFKQPENIQEFLEQSGLHSMLGVQPDTR
jgi:hypothetical protein